MKTPEGRERRERERCRREQEFDRVIAEEDLRQRATQSEEPPEYVDEAPAPLPTRVFE